MSVTRAEVERIARLGAVRLDEAALPELTRQLAGILAYVSQLEAVDAAGAGEPFRPGPERSPRRDDVVRAPSMAVGPEAFAPAFADGLFLVPRLEAMEDT